jgi:hypothetical protein
MLYATLNNLDYCIQFNLVIFIQRKFYTHLYESFWLKR